MKGNETRGSSGLTGLVALRSTFFSLLMTDFAGVMTLKFLLADGLTAATERVEGGMMHFKVPSGLFWKMCQRFITGES